MYIIYVYYNLVVVDKTEAEIDYIEELVKKILKFRLNKIGLL